MGGGGAHVKNWQRRNLIGIGAHHGRYVQQVSFLAGIGSYAAGKYLRAQVALQAAQMPLRDFYESATFVT